jgi:hypothetical protein
MRGALPQPHRHIDMHLLALSPHEILSVVSTIFVAHIKNRYDREKIVFLSSQDSQSFRTKLAWLTRRAVLCTNAPVFPLPANLQNLHQPHSAQPSQTKPPLEIFKTVSS